jgi:hypothetical protein
MNYLHQEFEAGPDDLIEVALDGQANVMLLDPENFERYRRREPFQYYGGLATVTPTRLVPPSRGRWHLAVDLGGRAGSVRAGVRLLRSAGAAR